MVWRRRNGCEADKVYSGLWTGSILVSSTTKGWPKTGMLDQRFALHWLPDNVGAFCWWFGMGTLSRQSFVDERSLELPPILLQRQSNPHKITRMIWTIAEGTRVSFAVPFFRLDGHSYSLFPDMSTSREPTTFSISWLSPQC